MFLCYLSQPKEGFVTILIEPIAKVLTYYHHDLIWIYNIFYFVFAFTLIDIKTRFLKWHKFIFRSVYFLFAYTILVEVLYSSGYYSPFIAQSENIFLVLISLLAVIGYIPLFRIDNPLKYYLIIGSLVLFVFSMSAMLISIFDVAPQSEINFSIFYIGVIIENILFSLALGHKQKLIIEEKEDTQQRLIKQLQENERLKHKVQEELEKNVAVLSEQAETEKLEKVKANFERELAELKVSSLQSQMNPHFIFNSLNAIKLYIINNEKENAIYYMNKFSKLIRKILSSTREREITLNEELETMKLYMDIENIRFGNEIEINIKLDPKLSLDTIRIPSLILQPFIENAIWHGLSAKKGSKKIGMDVMGHKNTHVQITITDNGIGRERSALINSKKLRKKKSVGIDLTRERLKNFGRGLQNRYSIKFKDLYDGDEKPSGTQVKLKIPIV